MLLSLSGVTKRFGDDIILDQIDAALNEGDRVGLVGVNGAGKTTLLQLICGRYTDFDGELSYKKELAIGYLEQNAGLDNDNSIWDEMLSVFSRLLKTERSMRQLEERMAELDHATEEFEKVSAEYARLSAYFEANEGYQIQVKIKTVLNGMGFGDKSYGMVIASLSGGEKTRLAITKLLLEEPELLILDEPTNHLDFASLRWLEEYLTTYHGALLIVSHDRYFLDKTVNCIWELEQQRLDSFRGNYSTYKLLKQQKLEYRQKEYERQQAKIASMLDYAERNIARASTSNSAKSRLHQLENMERVEKPFVDTRTPKFRFEYKKEPVKDVLQVEGLRLTVGDGTQSVTLCNSLSFAISRGEKIALIGPNGIGKSTLLKSLLGMLPQEGIIEWGRNVTTAYYDQENRQMNPRHSVLEELWDRFPRLREQEVRNTLGRVLLTGENVYKFVGMLSGGERARLGFAILMLDAGNFLVLDEPTNHLDLQTREALENALIRFKGTLLFVSHDRYLLNRIPGRILELSENGVASYEGNFDAYLMQKEKAPTKEGKLPTASVPSEEKAKYHRSKKQRSEEVRRKKRLQELEALIEETEIRQDSLQAEMSAPEAAADYQRIQTLCDELEEIKAAHDSYLEQWAALQEADSE